MTSRKSVFKTAALGVFLLALFALFVASQEIGGITWDEAAHRDGYRQQIEFAKGVLAGKTDQNFNDVRMAHYGILPILPAEFLTNRILLFTKVDKLAELEIFGYALHFYAFFLGIVTCYLVGRIVYIITNNDLVAYISGILLFLTPPWLGQSFFNYKDLTTAFAVILCLYWFVYAFEKEKYQISVAAYFGFVLSTIFLAGIKLTALVLILPLWIGAAYAVICDTNRIILSKYFILGCFIVIFGTFAITPTAWLEPFRYLWENLTGFSNIQYGPCNQTMGFCIQPSSLEWSAAHYLYFWYGVRTPLFILVLLPFSLFYLLTRRSLICLALFFLIVMPVILLILKNASLYDGIRHTLFLIPLSIIAAGIFVGEMGNNSNIIRNATIGVFLVVFIFLLIDNIRLFPYNFAYFNELSRKWAKKDMFDIDYWGFSLKESATAYSNEIHNKKLPIVAYPRHLLELHLDRDSIYKNEENLNENEEFIVISITRENRNLPQYCEKIHSVERRLIFSKHPMEFSFVGICKKN